MKYIIELEEDPESGDLIMPLSDEILKEAGWSEGDTLEWIDNKDGSYTLKKTDTQWVLVECVSTFRTRYMVEVPTGTDQFGKDKAEWALDTVTMEEATEFSSQHIGEQIISHRVVTKEEAIKLCDIDNDYTKSWDVETKMKNFFTTWEEQEA